MGISDTPLDCIFFAVPAVRERDDLPQQAYSGALYSDDDEQHREQERRAAADGHPLKYLLQGDVTEAGQTNQEKDQPECAEEPQWFAGEASIEIKGHDI